MNVLSFWGKAQPSDPGRSPEWHPLAFHCLDVAAVGEALLMQHRGLGSQLPRLLGLPGDDTLRLVCFLLSLHDIGKFAKKFQAKVPGRYPDCFDDDPARLAGIYDHGAGGLRLFDSERDFFEPLGGNRYRTWRPLISAVTGHHGAPPAPRMNETIVTLRSDFGAPGIAAARAFISQVYGLFSLPPELPSPGRAQTRHASFALAGLAVLADWIGSSQDWFPYCEQDDFKDLETYWDYAQEQANRAIAKAGVVPAGIRDCIDYDALIGAQTTPSPMQEWARTAELPAGPALFMVEDETGSGKTEAALMLAHRLMAAHRAEGLYIALPTMATANAMFDRLCAAHRKLFAEGEAPSVALAHGARDLHAGFRNATLRGGRSEDSYSMSGGEGEESETTASAACAAWIADDRRRTFLADIGAGTVDQALLSVLPNRHQSLRLLGLMRRVLVLDEVHAYDAYMQREIETLLEFQAGLGGSAILLSADAAPGVSQAVGQRLLERPRPRHECCRDGWCPHGLPPGHGACHRGRNRQKDPRAIWPGARSHGPLPANAGRSAGRGQKGGPVRPGHALHPQYGRRRTRRPCGIDGPRARTRSVSRPIRTCGPH